MTVYSQIATRADRKVSAGQRAVLAECQYGEAPMSVGREIFKPHVQALVQAAHAAIEEEFDPEVKGDFLEAAKAITAFADGSSDELITSGEFWGLL